MTGRFEENMCVFWSWTSRPSLLWCFFKKAMCTISTKQHNCRFLVLQRNIQHVRASFVLFTVVEAGSFVRWKVDTLFVWACWIIHISKNILTWFLRLFKNINPLTKLQEIWYCWFFRGTIAHLTRWRALGTLIVASVKWLKSLFVHAKYIRTLCIRTTRVPNKFNNAIVILRIRRDCTTLRNCSQLFHMFAT